MDKSFEPLNEEELDWLDHFLVYRIDEDADCKGMDEGVIDVSELDGFFTAIVSGPTATPPSRWIRAVWGDFQPVWIDEGEVELVMSLLMRHMNGIASCLMVQADDFDPMFQQHVVEGKTYTIVDDWCEGYMRGVALSAGLWDEDSVEMKTLLAPIAAFTEQQNFYAHDQCVLFALTPVEIQKHQLQVRRMHLKTLSGHVVRFLT